MLEPRPRQHAPDVILVPDPQRLHLRGGTKVTRPVRQAEAPLQQKGEIHRLAVQPALHRQAKQVNRVEDT